MYYLFLTLLILCTTALATTESAKEKVLSRARSHSGRTLSIISDNPDFGINTAELRKMLVKRKEQREKEEAEFLDAAKKGDDLTTFLKNEHFNFDAKDSNGKTALMYLAQLGRTSIVKTLLTRNAKAFSIRDSDGMNAHDHATGRPEIRRLMQEMQPTDNQARRSSLVPQAPIIHLSPDENDKKQ